MKTLQNISKLFLASLFLTACSTEEPGALDPNLHNPDTTTPSVTAGSLTSNVDGVAFMADFTTAVVTNGIITIEGKTGANTVALRFPQTITPNSTSSPYQLGANSTTYSGNYNTAINVTSTSTIEAPIQVSFDGQQWTSENEVLTITGGVTDLKGLVGAQGESLNIRLETDQSGAHTFGPITGGGVNTINYREAGAGAAIWNADDVAVNGAINLTVDATNKLVSGTFNFDGIRVNSMSTPPNYGTTDSDGDGVVDLKETYGPDGDPNTPDGTDPNNANDPIQVETYTGYDANNAIWQAADGDNDGITNADELIAMTDPYEGNVDADGDGVSDLQENVIGTDVNNPCDPGQNEHYAAYNATDIVWMAADCDGDGITNGDELAATPPTYPYFVELNMKAFTEGTFTNATFSDGGAPIFWGLNISAHDPAAKTISGTFSFVSNSIGETPVRSYVITGGAFDVTYE